MHTALNKVYTQIELHVLISVTKNDDQRFNIINIPFQIKTNTLYANKYMI